LKDNGHIYYKTSKSEKMEERHVFKNKVEEFKNGNGYLDLRDYVLNDKITITWIEND